MSCFPALILSLVLSPAATHADDLTSGAIWNTRTAEHLLNRAGFGPRRFEIEESVHAGRDATIERLLNPRADWEMPFYEPLDEPTKVELAGLSDEEANKLKREAREKDRVQLAEGMGWWINRMQSGEDPLLEKMTLFWHGFFTTSIDQAKRSYLVLQQHEFLRRNALGSYADLLRGIAKDPAMLVYLDNNANRKGNPNENFARELMELFSLGVGNYTESDVKEAARALTGRGTDRDGKFEFRAGQHDNGNKTVLGATGRLDADQLIETILRQEACPRWVAKKLITWFEGKEPDDKRLNEYAAFLRKSDFQMKPFLLKLFTDPRFYRIEIVGARVQGPVEYLVGISRRMGIQAPAATIGAGAALLGQRLFAPPSVKGWDEGYAWITTSTLMQRGNLAGMLLGIVKLDDVLSLADMEEAPSTNGGAAEPGTEPGMQPPTMKPDGPQAPENKKPEAKKAKSGKATGFAYDALRRAERSGWTPLVSFSSRLDKAGAHTDAEIVDYMLDDLLAIQSPDDTRERMRAFLAGERTALKLDDGKLLNSVASERVLRRLAHLILSLPEAQLE